MHYLAREIELVDTTWKDVCVKVHLTVDRDYWNLKEWLPMC